MGEQDVNAPFTIEGVLLVFPPGADEQSLVGKAQKVSDAVIQVTPPNGSGVGLFIDAASMDDAEERVALMSGAGIDLNEAESIEYAQIDMNGEIVPTYRRIPINLDNVDFELEGYEYDTDDDDADDTDSVVDVSFDDDEDDDYERVQREYDEKARARAAETRARQERDKQSYRDANQAAVDAAAQAEQDAIVAAAERERARALGDGDESMVGDVSHIDFEFEEVAPLVLPTFSPTGIVNSLSASVYGDLLRLSQTELLAPAPYISHIIEDENDPESSYDDLSNALHNDYLKEYMDEVMRLGSDYSNAQMTVASLDADRYDHVQQAAIALIEQCDSRRMQGINDARDGMHSELDGISTQVGEMRTDYAEGLREIMHAAAIEAARRYAAEYRERYIQECDDIMESAAFEVAVNLESHSTNTAIILNNSERGMSNREVMTRIMEDYGVTYPELRSYLACMRYRAFSDRAIAGFVQRITLPEPDEPEDYGAYAEPELTPEMQPDFGDVDIEHADEDADDEGEDEPELVSDWDDDDEWDDDELADDDLDDDIESNLESAFADIDSDEDDELDEDDDEDDEDDDDDDDWDDEDEDSDEDDEDEDSDEDDEDEDSDEDDEDEEFDDNGKPKKKRGKKGKKGEPGGLKKKLLIGGLALVLVAGLGFVGMNVLGGKSDGSTQQSTTQTDTSGSSSSDGKTVITETGTPDPWGQGVSVGDTFNYDTTTSDGSTKTLHLTIKSIVEDDSDPSLDGYTATDDDGQTYSISVSKMDEILASDSGDSTADSTDDSTSDSTTSSTAVVLG